MRALMVFTMGFALACAVGAWFGFGSWGFLAAMVLLAVAAVCLFFLEKGKTAGRVLGICLGCAVGIACFSLHRHYILTPAAALDGQTLDCSFLVTQYSYDSSYGTAFYADMEVEGRDYRVKGYLNEKAELAPGDRMEGSFRLRLTAEGGKSQPTYHRSDGIFLLAYQQDAIEVTPAQTVPWQCLPGLWHGKLTKILDSFLPEDAAAFVKALLLGDRSELPYSTKTDFKIAGISHIVAVSGLHVSVLFALVQLLTRRKRFLTALVGIPAVLAFAALVGFTPSITRAAIMQILMMLATCLDREADPLTSLSVACLCMLTVNPLVIESVSFQLSVSCVLGIFLFASPMYQWLMDKKRLGRWTGKNLRGKLVHYIATGTSVSLSASLFTVPLTALYFGTVSLIGVVGNLLILWLISFVFYAAVLLCLAGALWPWAAGVLGWTLAWPVRFVLGTAHLLAKLPLAAVYTAGEYIRLWLVAVYVLIGIFLLTKEKKPMVLASCIALSLVAAVLAQSVPPYFREHQVTMVDVGQGQSIILRSRGKVFVVDCGADDAETAADCTSEALLSQGISRIDGLILTHSDDDHSGGAEYLCQRIAVDRVFAPEKAGEELLLSGNGAVYVTEDVVLTFEGGRLTLFAPQAGKTGNDSSIAVLFQTEKCDTLITGDLSQDGELALMRRVNLPKLEVLVVGHHGAAASTSELLLRFTSPEIALISVGQNNPYKHPRQQTLARLSQAGCRIYRTDLNGTVTFWR